MTVRPTRRAVASTGCTCSRRWPPPPMPASGSVRRWSSISSRWPRAATPSTPPRLPPGPRWRPGPGRRTSTDLAAFCQRSIDGWYLATAAAQGQSEDALVYFAEKHFPDAYPRLMRELYPAARELFLVRDFRDMIASMLAYNARKGFGDFGRETAQSDAAWLADLRRGVVALRDAWRERGEPASLVRYEDLVRDPEATLPPLLTSLGLDAAPETVRRLIAAAAPDVPGATRARHGRLAGGLDRPLAARFAAGAAVGRRGDVWRSSPGVRLRVAGDDRRSLSGWSLTRGNPLHRGG